MPRRCGAMSSAVSPCVWSIESRRRRRSRSRVRVVAAALATVGCQRKPTPITSCCRPCDHSSRRSARSLPSAAVGVDSAPSMPKSALALSRPAAAASLNDLSPRARDVEQKASPTFTASALGAPVVPAGAAVVACAGTDSGAGGAGRGHLGGRGRCVVVVVTTGPARASAATTPAASKRLLMIIFSPFSETKGSGSRVHDEQRPR